MPRSRNDGQRQVAKALSALEPKAKPKPSEPKPAPEAKASVPVKIEDPATKQLPQIRATIRANSPLTAALHAAAEEINQLAGRNVISAATIATDLLREHEDYLLAEMKKKTKG